MGGVMDRIWRESPVAILAGLLGAALLCSCLAGLMIGYLPLSPAAAAEVLGDVLTGSDAGAAACRASCSLRGSAWGWLSQGS